MNGEKLEAEVKKLRASNMTAEQIAKRLGVSVPRIERVMKRDAKRSDKVAK